MAHVLRRLGRGRRSDRSKPRCAWWEFYDTAPSFVAALFARYDPIADSGYFVALRGDGSIIIRKRAQGKSASWAAGVDAGIVPDRWYTVRLEVLGNTANAFLDGRLVYSVVDGAPLAQGTAALGTYGATLKRIASSSHSVSVPEHHESQFS